MGGIAVVIVATALAAAPFADASSTAPAMAGSDGSKCTPIDRWPRVHPRCVEGASPPRGAAMGARGDVRDPATPRAPGRSDGFRAPPPGPLPGGGYLQRGVPGADPHAVRLVQRRLSTVGFPVHSDGLYGPRTAAAVRRFQVANGLLVDAIVGRQTAAALRERAREPVATSSSGRPPPQVGLGDEAQMRTRVFRAVAIVKDRLTFDLRRVDADSIVSAALRSGGRRLRIVAARLRSAVRSGHVGVRTVRRSGNRVALISAAPAPPRSRRRAATSAAGRRSELLVITAATPASTAPPQSAPVATAPGSMASAAAPADAGSPTGAAPSPATAPPVAAPPQQAPPPQAPPPQTSPQQDPPPQAPPQQDPPPQAPLAQDPPPQVPPAAAALPAPFPARLRASGRKIVDDNGYVLPTLRGFNVHVGPGFTWSQSHFDDIAAIGAKINRAVIHWDQFEPSQGVISETAISNLDLHIARARAAGIYTLLELHLNVARTPSWTAAQPGEMEKYAVYGHTLTRYLAQRYGNPASSRYTEAVIGFGLNEPPLEDNALRNGTNSIPYLEAKQRQMITWMRAPGHAPDWIAFVAYGYASATPIYDDSWQNARAVDASPAAYDSVGANVIIDVHDYFIGCTNTNPGCSGRQWNGMAYPTYQGGPLIGTGDSPAPSYTSATYRRAQHAAFLAPYKSFSQIADIPLMLGEWGWQEGASGELAWIDDARRVWSDGGTVIEIQWNYDVTTNTSVNFWAARPGKAWRPSVTSLFAPGG